MANNKCIADNCNLDSVARGMCKKHWSRWRKGKDINEKSYADKTARERFFEKVDKTDDCWMWTGSQRGSKGMMYGVFNYNGKSYSAHRFSYELHNGEIKSEGGDYRGLCVCHTCDNPRCVNPDHLFLGTHTDNMRDKIKKGRCGQANKTHCPKGHEYSKENTYISKRGIRSCKTCNKEREAKRRSLIKER